MGAALSRGALRWALEAIVCQYLTVARVADGLGVSWNTANTAVLAEGRRVLIDDPHRFDGVKVIGVDEHVWRHTRRGDKYVTVIIDLTPVRDHTGADLLTDKQKTRIEKLFSTDDHVQVEVTWNVYQRMISAYRDPDRGHGKTALRNLIDSIRTGVPTALIEIRRLGSTLHRRAANVLAFFDRPGTSNGPTEAINGRLEHLRGSALGFGNHSSRPPLNLSG